MNITTILKEITPAVNIPAVVERKYVLELSAQEASDLMALCGGIGGPHGSPLLNVDDTARTTFNPIFFKLEELQVIPNYGRLNGLYSKTLTLKK